MRIIYLPTITEEHYNIEDLSSEQLELIREAMEHYHTDLDLDIISIGNAEGRGKVSRKVHMLQNLLKKTSPPSEIVSFQPQDVEDFKIILNAVANNLSPALSDYRLNELNEQMKEL